MLNQKTIKHLRALRQKKFRKQYGEFLVEGFKGVQEALEAYKNNFDTVRLLIIDNTAKNDEVSDIKKVALKRGISIEFCSHEDVGKIKTTETFPGILAVIKKQDCALEMIISDNQAILCLDGVSDPGNLGTIIRTADWFGFRFLILSEDCVELYNPKVVRSTMGSLFRAKIFHSVNLAQTLNKLRTRFNYHITGMALDGENITQIKPTKRQIFVLGNETRGLRPQVENLCEKRYTINGTGQAESLNVAVASSILLYVLSSKKL